MTYNIIKTSIYLIIITLTLSSCVAKKKYVESENQRKKMVERVQVLGNELDSAKNNITELNASINRLNNDLFNLKTAKKLIEDKNAALQKELDEITSEALSQKQKMDAAFKKKIEELEKREKAIEYLQKAINEKDKDMKDVLSHLEKAMKQYNSDDLTIELIDGKVYVAIADKLLFKSGSIKVDAKGKEALSVLAEVLLKHPELDVIVEGHTDNVPIKTERFGDNWDLSVIRATTVVRILTVDYGIPTEQMTASGKGEYFPKGSNETVEGKAANRRTEIIIAPNLAEIFNLLKK